MVFLARSFLMYPVFNSAAKSAMKGAAKSVGKTAQRMGKAMKGRDNLGSAAIAIYQQNQQLQRDFFELDSRDFDELEARASHGLTGTILHHAGKFGPSIFENGASLASQAMQPQQPYGQTVKRDLAYEMDIEARGPGGYHGIGGSVGGIGHKTQGQPQTQYVQSREEEEFWARRFVFSVLYRLDCTEISLHHSLSFYGDFDELD